MALVPERERHLRVAGDGYRAAYDGVGEEYDPKGFYVRSKNKHDHRSETRVAMVPEVYGQIQTLLASGNLGGTPINSYQSFMRDAAVHNLHRLGTLLGNDELLQFAARQRHLSLIEQEAERTDMLKKIVADADERLNTATKTNDAWFVDHLVTMYETLHATMREPFATELEDVLLDARRWLRAHPQALSE